MVRVGGCGVLMVSAAVLLGCVGGGASAGDYGWRGSSWSTAEADPLSVRGQVEVGLGSLPGVLWDDAKAVGSRPANLAALAALGGASIALRGTGVDRRAARQLTSHPILGGRADEAVQLLGNPGTHFAAAGLWYLAAAATHDQDALSKAGTMISGLSLTGLTTVALKLAVWDRTPNEKYFGWPSGHTASSFTVASILDEQYGPRVGVPAYLVASFVGYRMLESGDHWLSDVLFGAVLGWVVGHGVARRHAEVRLGGMQVGPFLDPRTGAVGVSFWRRF